MQMNPLLEMSILGTEEKETSLLDVASFLYDFNLGYEVSRLVADPKYEGFHFSHFVYYRKGRPLEIADRLIVHRLSHQSPIELITIVAAVPAAVAAAWGIVQIVERVTNFRLNRQKLELEVRKLQLETGKLQANIAKSEQMPIVIDVESFQVQSAKMGAAPVVETITKRLEASKVKIKLLDFKIKHTQNISTKSKGRGHFGDNPQK